MTDTPVTINPSVTPAQIKTVVRYFLTFAGPFLPKLFSGFFTPEIQAVIQSDEFATMISASSGAIIGIAMAAWGVFDTWRHKTQLVAAATAAPDTKFVVAKPGEAK
jgi:hypothetical protein